MASTSVSLGDPYPSSSKVADLYEQQATNRLDNNVDSNINHDMMLQSQQHHQQNQNHSGDIASRPLSAINNGIHHQIPPHSQISGGVQQQLILSPAPPAISAYGAPLSHLPSPFATTSHPQQHQQQQPAPSLPPPSHHLHHQHSHNHRNSIVASVVGSPAPTLTSNYKSSLSNILNNTATTTEYTSGPGLPSSAISNNSNHSHNNRQNGDSNGGHNVATSPVVPSIGLHYGYSNIPISSTRSQLSIASGNAPRVASPSSNKQQQPQQQPQQQSHHDHYQVTHLAGTSVSTMTRKASFSAASRPISSSSGSSGSAASGTGNNNYRNEDLVKYGSISSLINHDNTASDKPNSSTINNINSGSVPDTTSNNNGSTATAANNSSHQHFKASGHSSEPSVEESVRNRKLSFSVDLNLFANDIDELINGSLFSTDLDVFGAGETTSAGLNHGAGTATNFNSSNDTNGINGANHNLISSDGSVASGENNHNGIFTKPYDFNAAQYSPSQQQIIHQQYPLPRQQQQYQAETQAQVQSEAYYPQHQQHQHQHQHQISQDLHTTESSFKYLINEASYHEGLKNNQDLSLCKYRQNSISSAVIPLNRETRFFPHISLSSIEIDQSHKKYLEFFYKDFAKVILPFEPYENINPVRDVLLSQATDHGYLLSVILACGARSCYQQLQLIEDQQACDSYLTTSYRLFVKSLDDEKVLINDIEPILLTVLLLTAYNAASKHQAWRTHLRGAKDLLKKYAFHKVHGSVILSFCVYWFVSFEMLVGLNNPYGGTLLDEKEIDLLFRLDDLEIANMKRLELIKDNEFNLLCGFRNAMITPIKDLIKMLNKLKRNQKQAKAIERKTSNINSNELHGNSSATSNANNGSRSIRRVFTEAEISVFDVYRLLGDFTAERNYKIISTNGIVPETHDLHWSNYNYQQELQQHKLTSSLVKGIGMLYLPNGEVRLYSWYDITHHEFALAALLAIHTQLLGMPLDSALTQQLVREILEMLYFLDYIDVGDDEAQSAFKSKPKCKVEAKTGAESKAKLGMKANGNMKSNLGAIEKRNSKEDTSEINENRDDVKEVDQNTEKENSQENTANILGPSLDSSSSEIPLKSSNTTPATTVINRKTAHESGLSYFIMHVQWPVLIAGLNCQTEADRIKVELFFMLLSQLGVGSSVHILSKLRKYWHKTATLVQENNAIGTKERAASGPETGNGIGLEEEKANSTMKKTQNSFGEDDGGNEPRTGSEEKNEGNLVHNFAKEEEKKRAKTLSSTTIAPKTSEGEDGHSAARNNSTGGSKSGNDDDDGNVEEMDIVMY